MRIIIIGGSGQLGRDCSSLLEKEHTIYSYTSGELDITDKSSLHGTITSIKPDLIINCAAYTAVDQCETEQKRCMEVNGNGPGILAGEAVRSDSKLIHISTDYVFSGSKPLPEPYTEKDPVAPLSFYGQSKLAGEEAIRQRTANHLIIRTAWLYGRNGHNFLKTMLRLAVNNPGQTIRVVNDQYGSLTWTRSLARQIARLVETDLTGTIHATSEGFSSWYEGARKFLEAMEVDHIIEPCSTADYPTPAPRPANSILENSRLKKHDFNIMPAWDDDVVRFSRTFRDELLAEAANP
jgi:dTDP-4-dehydrorhamnose reductase